MQINTTNLGQWATRAIEGKLLPSIVELCLHADINSAHGKNKFDYLDIVKVELAGNYDSIFIEGEHIKIFDEDFEDKMNRVRDKIVHRELLTTLSRMIDQINGRLQSDTGINGEESGVVDFVWCQSYFESISSRILLKAPGKKRPFGYQISNTRQYNLEDKKILDECFIWFRTVEECVNFIVMESRELSSLTQYTKIYNSVTWLFFNKLEFSYSENLPFELSMIDMLKIGPYKLITGNGRYENTVLMVQGSETVLFYDVAYLHNNYEFMKMLTDNYKEDILNIFYAWIITKSISNSLIENIQLEEKINQLKTHQFIIERLDRSINKTSESNYKNGRINNPLKRDLPRAISHREAIIPKFIEVKDIKPVD